MAESDMGFARRATTGKHRWHHTGYCVCCGLSAEQALDQGWDCQPGMTRIAAPPVNDTGREDDAEVRWWLRARETMRERAEKLAETYGAAAEASPVRTPARHVVAASRMHPSKPEASIPEGRRQWNGAEPQADGATAPNNAKPNDGDGPTPRKGLANAVQGAAHAVEGLSHALRQVNRPVTLVGQLWRYGPSTGEG